MTSLLKLRDTISKKRCHLLARANKPFLLTFAFIINITIYFQLYEFS